MTDFKTNIRNPVQRKRKPYRQFLFILCVLPLFFWQPVHSQDNSYELIPAPDIWYNDVDGIRLGVRLKGQVPGTFDDGPHRLDAGVWLGTWFPDLPLSYYFSFTEPVFSWSRYGSEAHLRLISSVRTGYQSHGLGLHKRWQRGFDERRYVEAGIFNSFEDRFDGEYIAFPYLWSRDHKILTTLTAEFQNENPLGVYAVSFSGSFQYLDRSYGVGNLTASQQIDINRSWTLRLRGFAGAASSGTDAEYLFSRSFSPAVETLQSGITRAKGTIPQPWMESGNFHVAGGANLRGYTSDDIDNFVYKPCVSCSGDVFINEVSPVLFRSIAAFNSELDYPNPAGILFDRIPYLGEFMSFRSYLFFDAGTPLGIGEDNIHTDTVFADGGAGFALSLNIPDYLGKPRGFVLRYEMPFWLSEPGGNQEAFKFRHLFAVGTVISF